MNRKVSTKNPFLVGLFLLAAGVPCAVAQTTDAGKKAPDMSPGATILPGPPAEGSFTPDPPYLDPYDANEQLKIYSTEPDENGKLPRHMNPNPTGVPPVELGIRLYDRGAYTPRSTWLFGPKDPGAFGFMTYGDLRIAGDSYDNGKGAGKQSVVAARLNLDMDLALTPTERIHAFARPLDKNNSFTRYAISGTDKDKFIHKFDFDLDTLFFEGDAGQISGGLMGKPAKNIPSLDVSNIDVTFFAANAQVTTAAAAGSKNGVYGFAGFADARKGYIEFGYGYLKADNDNLSYSNVTAAFTRRYKGRLSNSIRVIDNFGQKGIPGQAKTADGLLVLVENSLTPKYLPLALGNQSNFVPYLNVFAGFNSPQSLARGGDSGGVLRNTGITFESDGMTAYPTLDATARKSYGGALGLEYLFELQQQIV